MNQTYKNRALRALMLGISLLRFIVFGFVVFAAAGLWAVFSNSPAPAQTAFQRAVASRIFVQPWPPDDPNEENAKYEFTSSWAKRMMGFRSLTELQIAAGSRGKITERGSGAGMPFASYHWISMPVRGRTAGFMLARQYSDGNVGVSLLTTDGREIAMNTFGAFICDGCRPPVEIRGSTPTWSH